MGVKARILVVFLRLFIDRILKNSLLFVVSSSGAWLQGF